MDFQIGLWLNFKNGGTMPEWFICGSETIAIGVLLFFGTVGLARLSSQVHQILGAVCVAFGAV